MIRPLALKEMRGNLPQLLLYGVEQPLASVFIAAAPECEQGRDLLRVGQSPSECGRRDDIRWPVLPLL
jgi:hypothetical protein